MLEVDHLHVVFLVIRRRHCYYPFSCSPVKNWVNFPHRHVDDCYSRTTLPSLISNMFLLDWSHSWTLERHFSIYLYDLPNTTIPFQSITQTLALTRQWPHSPTDYISSWYCFPPTLPWQIPGMTLQDAYVFPPDHRSYRRQTNTFSSPSFALSCWPFLSRTPGLWGPTRLPPPTYLAPSAWNVCSCDPLRRTFPSPASHNCYPCCLYVKCFRLPFLLFSIIFAVPPGTLTPLRLRQLTFQQLCNHKPPYNLLSRPPCNNFHHLWSISKLARNS
jgi:hypothetical protein